MEGNLSRNNDDEQASTSATNAQRQRSRAVAEREASRLARPETSVASNNNSKIVSSLAQKNTKSINKLNSSTPFGRNYKDQNNKDDNNDAWCGPFSIARQMIAAREEARRIREEEAKEEKANDNENNDNDNDDNIDILQGFADDIHDEIQKKQHPSLNWKGNKSTIEEASRYNNTYIKRRKRYELLSLHNTKKRIPSLLQICLNTLVDNFNHVESLGYGIDSTMRKLICETLISKGKFNGAAFDILTEDEDSIESLEIGDCAIITQVQLCETLDRLLPHGILKAILLEYAGRCFCAKAVDIICKYKDVTSIFALSISGAYLLDDISCSNLIASLSSHLSSIEFKACPLLGKHFCQSIATSYTSTITSPSSSSAPLLELLLEDINLTKDQLLLLNSTNALSYMRQLKLSRILNVDDEVIQSLLRSTKSLQSIILHDLDNVTDISLITIRNCNINDTLRVLTLSSLKDITDIGLELLFSSKDVSQNNSSNDITYEISTFPPKLTRLDLSDNRIDVVTDNIMSLVLQTYGTTTTTSCHESTSNNNYINKFSRNNIIGLTYLNLSNTTSITDHTMEYLSSSTSCQQRLQELNISFCPKISDKGLGYLVSKIHDQFHKLSIWGCAQITDEFLDGHDRVHKKSDDDDGLDIIGTWMKRRKL